MKKVYMFNFLGESIGEFESVSSAAEKMGVEVGNMSKIIKEGRLVKKYYYFSFSKEFMLPKKKNFFNPLFSKLKNYPDIDF